MSGLVRGAAQDTGVAVRRVPVRGLVWAFHMALPLFGLWLLVARPELDVVWENHLTHFWLVVAVAATNVVIGLRMSEASRRREDARLFLVSLAFISSAGFLLLHAMATPEVILSGRNAGFIVATPVGLFIAALFAVASSFNLGEKGAAVVIRSQRLLRGTLGALFVAWGAISLLELPPLDRPIDPSEAHGPLVAFAGVAVALYAFAAARYFALYRRRPGVMLLSVISAFVLLAEAMIAVAFARNWHVSWWEWHLLMALGFGFVAYSADVQYRREGSAGSLFNTISLEQTIREIRVEHGAALEALVSAMGRAEETGQEQPIGPLATRLAKRFDLTESQAEILERGAEALFHEREQIQRLDGLVAMGREARVILSEDDLLERVTSIADKALGRDTLRVGLIREGRLELGPGPTAHELPDEAVARALRTLEPVELPSPNGPGAVLLLPITVKDHPAGVLEVHRERGRFADRDRSLMQSLASQLSIALENARLYRQIDSLFRSYMSPDVATSLLADPAQAALGGAIAEVTVLFADLRGFTTFSERSSPDRVVALLNRYFGIAVPLVLEQGGTVVQFVGDALMALFNAPTRQPDHALRAARAALAIQRGIEEIASGHPDWPRFRVGINTGQALVGNIGSAELRYFTAIGDPINLGSRLETTAEVGQVVIGGATYQQIKGVAEVRALGKLHVKGKQEPVEAFLLIALRE